MGQLHRLSPEGRGPFDVSGQKLRIEGDRVWMGAVDITEAIVVQSNYEFSVDTIDVTGLGEDHRSYAPSQRSVRVTVELMLPGEFKVKDRNEDEWTGPVFLDQKELL